MAAAAAVAMAKASKVGRRTLQHFCEASSRPNKRQKRGGGRGMLAASACRNCLTCIFSDFCRLRLSRTFIASSKEKNAEMVGVLRPDCGCAQGVRHAARLLTFPSREGPPCTYNRSAVLAAFCFISRVFRQFVAFFYKVACSLCFAHKFSHLCGPSRAELVDLRTKFEEDRHRIQNLRASRNFKPY